MTTVMVDVSRFRRNIGTLFGEVGFGVTFGAKCFAFCPRFGVRTVSTVRRLVVDIGVGAASEVVEASMCSAGCSALLSGPALLIVIVFITVVVSTLVKVTIMTLDIVLVVVVVSPALYSVVWYSVITDVVV